MNNFIYGCKDKGISCGKEFDKTNSENILIKYNTFIKCQNGVVVKSGTINAQVINNTFYDNHKSIWCFKGWVTEVLI